MRKGKMLIPRVNEFDDLFSMDVISKVVSSGFGDPFMFLKSTGILWLGLVVDRRLITIDRRICCTGTARCDWRFTW
jgi:hypothetical protein